MANIRYLCRSNNFYQSFINLMFTMKHFQSPFSLAAIALVAGIIFTACSKDDDSSSTGGTTAPATLPQAGSDARYSITSENSDIDFIELTSSMTYIVAQKGAMQRRTRSVDDPLIIEGNYTFKDGVYYLEGWGTIVISTSEDGQVTLDVTPEGNTEAITLTADYDKPVLTDGNAKKLCKSWTFGTYHITMRILTKKFDREYTPEQMKNMPYDVEAFLVDAAPLGLGEYFEDMPLDDLGFSEEDFEDVPEKFVFTTYGTVLSYYPYETEIDYWKWVDQKKGIIQIGDEEFLEDEEPVVFTVSYRGSQLYLELVLPSLDEMMDGDVPPAVVSLMQSGFNVGVGYYFNPAK